MLRLLQLLLSLLGLLLRLLQLLLGHLRLLLRGLDLCAHRLRLGRLTLTLRIGDCGFVAPLNISATVHILLQLRAIGIELTLPSDDVRLPLRDDRRIGVRVLQVLDIRAHRADLGLNRLLIQPLAILERAERDFRVLNLATKGVDIGSVP